MNYIPNQRGSVVDLQEKNYDEDLDFEYVINLLMLPLSMTTMLIGGSASCQNDLQKGMSDDDVVLLESYAVF